MFVHDNTFEGVFYYTVTKVVYRSNYSLLFLTLVSILFKMSLVYTERYIAETM